ncbi:MAG: Ig-like domain-containing protein, partial [Planctomycetaceae bacterium]|nr:Ig-like domain-containing protein [Planctomycetaceae bacterium]
MKHLVSGTKLLLLAVVATSVCQADEIQPASLIVAPADIHLSAVRDRQSLIVQAVLPNGLTVDVTDKVTMAIENESLLRREGNTMYPVADGTTKLTVSYAGHAVDVPVVVQNAAVDPPISFRLDVMPVFMKTSCNNGSCHGAARGKDGFRISLFGFDPEGDHYRLTREIPGRRINLAIPSESLLVEKGAGVVPHTGGKRFDVGDEKYNTLIRWLEAGAPNDQGAVPAVVSVELYPKNAVMDGEGATQRLTVRAKYSDGTDRDVTSLAYFSSANENSAEIDQSGLVTAHARGEAFIMARFETHTVGSHFIVLPKGLQYED